MTNPFGSGLTLDETKTKRKAQPHVTSDGYSQSADAARRDPIASGDDDTETPLEDAAELGDQEADVIAYPGKGELLEEPDLKKVAKAVIALEEDQEEFRREHRARWLANEKRRRGIVGVQVLTDRTSDDRVEYNVYTPPGSQAIAPTFNKLNRSCRRLKANVFVDAFIPEATPGEATGSDDSEAAEFTTRALQAETTGPSLDLHKIGKRVFDLASTYDSAFAEYYVHPKAGGKKPRQIEASPAATTVEDATFRTVMQPAMVPDPSGTIDPASGQPAMVPDPTQPPVAQRVPQPGPFVMRYVKVDGTLTDIEAEAEPVWVPKLKAETFTARQGFFLPPTCDSIDEADAFIISTYTTLGDLRSRFPKVQKMGREAILELLKYKPKHPKDFLPRHLKQPVEYKPKADSEDVPDETHVFVTRIYFAAGSAYEDGGYIVVGGDADVLHRQTLEQVVEDHRVQLPICVAQLKQFDDGTEDPYGRGLVHVLGSGNEVRASLVMNAIEALARINSAKTFYTPASLFQPKTAQLQDVYVAIEQGTKPEREQVQPWPDVGQKLLEFSTTEMDDEAGLPPIIAGQNPPEVQSGLHAQTLIEQANVGLSDVRQHTIDFYVRSWRICNLLMKCGYTVPQQAEFLGDDESHKREEWIGSELETNVNIRLLPGSGTMLAPSSKLAVAEYAAKLGMVGPAQLKRMWMTNSGGLIGVQDDPHLNRVERQIRRFLKGPPKDNGKPIDPALWPAEIADIWARMPNDLDPAIAAIREDELSRAISSTRFSRLDPIWQSGMIMEYQQMWQIVHQPAMPTAVDASGQPVGQPTGGGANAGLDGSSGATSNLTPQPQVTQ